MNNEAIINDAVARGFEAVEKPVIAVSGGTGPYGDAAAAAWKQGLQIDERGQPAPNLANAALALRQAPELLGAVAYDEMLRHVVVTRVLPESPIAQVSGSRALQDTDEGVIQEWLQRQGLRRLGKNTAQQAISLVAREHTFHPVKKYLHSLRWDGVPRISSWLSTYLGADATQYTAAIGRWFLIAMAARIMTPGCKADYMLVLEGDQGAHKSIVCAILGGTWFSDALPDLHRGDQIRISMHLRGKWIIEIGELSSIGKAESGALKAFLTQTEERYTPKFGHNEVIEPRQCVFIGTTNKTAYLHDETGGRRFWPVKVGVIDTVALATGRDQLFAEAVVAFRAGERWWPDGDFERTHIQPEQAARYEADAWEELIVPFLAERQRATVLEVARWGLFIETPRIGTAEQRRITAIMKRVGWGPGNRGPQGERYLYPLAV